MPESNANSLDAVFAAAIKLSVDERELLVAMLATNDNPGWAGPEIEHAWMEEVARREQLAREGKMETYTWDEVRERLLARLAVPRD